MEPSAMDLDEDFVLVTAPLKREVYTPSLDSLPFLVSRPSSPGSEYEFLEAEFRHFNLTEETLLEIMDEQYGEQDNFDEEILEEISADVFRDWRGKVADYIEANGISEMEVQPIDGPVTQAPELLAPPPAESRRGGRNATDLELEMALVLSARTHEAEETKRNEPSWPNMEREAIVPPMLTPLEPEFVPFLDFNSAVDDRDVLTQMEYWLPDPDFTPEEQHAFEYFYMYYPKRFGQISRQMGRRNYRDCLKHYYLTKAKEKYKEKERGKGKRGGRKALRGGSSMRPKAMALMPLFDGADAEAPPAAVTDTGRPRRAAAPTFGDVVEAEPVTPLPKRTPVALKGDGTGDTPSERTSAKRTRGASARGGGGGRRGKAAAISSTAPLGISPQKVDRETNKAKIKEPKVEPDTQPEDLEFARVLAGMPNGGPPAFAVSALAAGNVFHESQPMPPIGTFQIQHGPSMIQPPQQIPGGQDMPAPTRVDGTTPNSYWSVPEITDFKTYLGYFGTDWQSIAITMKTKSATMIKNYYHRETKDDKIHAQALKRLAEDANEKRNRGEDLGPLPPPSQIQKRRYDSSSHMLHSRSTVPINDGTAGGFDSPALQPRLAQASPPQFSALAPRGPPTSQPEQTMTTTNPTPQRHLLSSAPSDLLPPNGGSMPRVPGSNHGPHQDEPTRSGLPTTPGSQQDLSVNVGGLQQQQELREYRPMRERAHHQDGHPGQRPMHEVVQFHHLSGQAQQNVVPEAVSAPVPAYNVNRTFTSGQVTLPPSQPIEADLRQPPRDFGQSPSRNDGRAQPQQSAGGRQPPPESTSAARPYDALESSQSNRSAIKENTRISSVMSPVQDMTRSNSVPAKPAAQPLAPPSHPPPPQESRPVQPPPRRVNVMSLLNDDPVEPEPTKKQVGIKPAIESTLQRQSQSTSQAHSYYGQSVQSHARRDFVTDPIGPSHHHQSRPSFGHTPQPSQQQGLPPHQPRDSGQPFSHMAQQRRYLDQQSTYQSSGRDSPQIPNLYPSQTARPAFPNLQRPQAPSPPPSMTAHSRTSSYNAPSPLHHQPRQNQIPSHSQTNFAAARGPALQGSIYARMSPSQHLASHPRQHVQQQQQQGAPPPPAPQAPQQHHPYQQHHPTPPSHGQRDSLAHPGALRDHQVEIVRRDDDRRSRFVHEPQPPPQPAALPDRQQRPPFADPLPYQRGPHPGAHPGLPPFARSTLHPAGAPSQQQASVETRAQQELDLINQQRRHQEEQAAAMMRERERERERHFAGSPSLYEGRR